MDNNKKNIFNIDEEIRIKRYNPDYLATYFETIIDNLDKEYGSNFQEVSSYKKNFKQWKKKLFKPNKKFNDFIGKTNEIIKLSESVLKEEKLDSKKTRKLDALFKEINSEDNSLIFDDMAFKENLDEATQLIVAREKILSKNRISTIISSVLLKYNILWIFNNIIVFTLSFILSHYIGNYIGNYIEINVSFWILSSQFIIALLLFLLFDFLIFDKIVSTIEEWLKWKIVKNLYIKLQKLSIDICIENKFQNNVEQIITKKHTK